MIADPRGRKLRLGTFLSIGSPVVAEVAALSGFDWLLFDLEHGCGSEAGLLGCLQATRGAPLSRIVRIGANRAELVARVLDWGADGIMLPHVDSPREAERLVLASHYPPRGHRGYSRSVRAFDYGLHRPVGTDLLGRPLLLAQVESLCGVENAAMIAAVEGIDVLFIGPTDLSLDLQDRAASETYAQCLAATAGAAAGAGKQAGILLRDWSDAPQLSSLGFTCFAAESDLMILREGFGRIVRQSRQEPDPG